MARALHRERIMLRGTLRSLALVTIAIAWGVGCGSRSALQDSSTTGTTGTDTPACSGGLSFTDSVEVTLDASPLSLAAADVDGDGKPEIFATAGGVIGYSQVAVMQNQGNGTLAAPAYLGVPMVARAVAAADMDGDGKRDLLIRDFVAGTVAVLPNQGDGTFGAAVVHAVGDEPSALAVADLNGDGRLDLVVGNFDSTTVSVRLGQGKGAFAPVVTYGTGWHPQAIVTADLNGDGQLDAAVARGKPDGVDIFINQGDGTFAPAVTTFTSDGILSLAVADMNGDGTPDLVAVFDKGAAGTAVGVLSNQGEGTFAAPVEYSSGPAYQTVAVADLDGDGRPDLAVTDGISEMAVLRNQGDGAFGLAGTFDVGPSRFTLLSTDVNGDGRLDIVLGTDLSTVRVLLNTCTP